jgi:hypothetical protein
MTLLRLHSLGNSSKIELEVVLPGSPPDPGEKVAKRARQFGHGVHRPRMAAQALVASPPVGLMARAGCQDAHPAGQHTGPVQRTSLLRERRAPKSARPTAPAERAASVWARAQHRQAVAVRVGFLPPRGLSGTRSPGATAKKRVAAEYGLSLCRYCCSVLARRREGHWTYNPVRLLTARRRAYR